MLLRVRYFVGVVQSKFLSLIDLPQEILVNFGSVLADMICASFAHRLTTSGSQVIARTGANRTTRRPGVIQSGKPVV